MKRLGLVIAILALPAAATAFDVTACGQTVPVRQTGILQTDLVCVGSIGVFLDHAAILDLNGHSIDMTGSAPPHLAVSCLGRTCRVVSPPATPGSLLGPSAISRGIVSASGVTIRNVSIDGFEYGVYARRVVASNLHVSNSNNYCVYGDRVRLTDSSLIGCGGGIAVDIKVSARNLTVADNLVLGIDAGQRLSGRNVIVINNGLLGIDATAGRNNHLGKLSLRNSQVTGHGIDLSSARRPVLRNTPCGSSQRVDDVTYAPIGSWGMCSND